MCKLPVVFLSETISHEGNFQYMVAIFTSLLPPMKLWGHNANLLQFRGKLVSISKKIRQAIEKSTQQHVLTFAGDQNGGGFFEGPSKMTKILSTRSAKSSQLSLKERSIMRL